MDFPRFTLLHFHNSQVITCQRDCNHQCEIQFLHSTIGFGDMVPDRNVERIRSPVVRRVYLAGIIIWIILGMGYIWGVVEIISGTLKAGRLAFLILVVHSSSCVHPVNQ